ncbi:hypothetical protein M9458_012340, partial [Cirrhinus mrigala]
QNRVWLTVVRIYALTPAPPRPRHQRYPRSSTTRPRRFQIATESVGRRNLLRHPNPLPPLLTNRDSDYELEPPDRGRKRAIDNQY